MTAKKTKTAKDNQPIMPDVHQPEPYMDVPHPATYMLDGVSVMDYVIANSITYMGDNHINSNHLLTVIALHLQPYSPGYPDHIFDTLLLFGCLRYHINYMYEVRRIDPFHPYEVNDALIIKHNPELIHVVGVYKLVKQLSLLDEPITKYKLSKMLPSAGIEHINTAILNLVFAGILVFDKNSPVDIGIDTQYVINEKIKPLIAKEQKVYHIDSKEETPKVDKAVYSFDFKDNNLRELHWIQATLSAKIGFTPSLEQTVEFILREVHESIAQPYAQQYPVPFNTPPMYAVYPPDTGLFRNRNYNNK